MMKNLLKRLLMLTLAAVMVLSMSTTALAADRTITFTGAKTGFDFAPGSTYTASDLFDNFKNVMPGDKLEQKVTIVHKAADCDYIKVYMRVEPHDAKNKPQVDVELTDMQAFLSKLTMRIYNGDKLIYQSSPDKAGNLADNTFLGVVDKDQKVTLRVELEVPKDLDNTYANRIGEMDWVFTAEGFSYQSITAKKVWDDSNDKRDKRPTSITVDLYDGKDKLDSQKLSKDNNWTYTWEDLDGEGDYTVKESKVPSGYSVSYKETQGANGNVTWKITNSMELIQTGQLNWPIPVLGSLGVLMICIGILLLKRKEQGNA